MLDAAPPPVYNKKTGFAQAQPQSEYPGIAKLVSRLVWDQETVRSSRTTRTKSPLKLLISEGFFLFFVYCGAEFEFVILNISFLQFLCKVRNDYTSYQIVLYF